MVAPESTLFVLLLILSLGLIIPELFRKFRLPFVTVLILLGAVLGPSGLDYIQLNDTISFFGFLGMAFLMFMAGIETDLSRIRRFRKKVLIMSILNGVVPFIVGLTITRYFGYSWTSSFLVGVIFISSSVAIIVPSLKSSGIFKKDIGQLILSSVLIADIVSLLALGFIFQREAPITKLPLLLYYAVLILSIACLFFIVPRISKSIIKKFSKDAGYERKLRFVIIVLISILAYFSVLGVHPILAGFLVGLMLSKVIHEEKTKTIYSKIHTLGYGFFVPIFFFIVGMELDLSLFREFDISNILMISLIFGLILSKIVSGYVAGKIVRLSERDSLMFGTISIVQLTTTLAVTFAASSLNLLDNVIVTSVILLSIITTILGPMVLSLIVKKN